MEETEKISRRLDRMLEKKNIDEESALKYLNRLRSMDMTLDILTKTGVGIIINKIRKESDNPEITSLGKSIIKRWKKLVPAEKNESNAGSKRSPSEEPNGCSDDDASKQSKKSKVDDSAESDKKQEVQAKLMYNVNKDTNDEVRLKAREMICSALQSADIPSGAYDCAFLASRIETSIFKIFNDSDSKYKQRIRTRVMNLRDSNNPNLRINVLMGHVKPDKLAVMTSEEMASKEMKDLREKYNKEVIEDHQMATTGGTETDLLQCGKCRQKKCTYNQVQTRSADEPMTTFVYCNNCGHRWKFC